ncbi:hypothetical protein CVT25_005078 [Psilocybe cyanescens]|uniref:Uncharacterized protein n=1 Tax=Psilocybe cyanescens TaxID=93625 RepID=A0A409XDW4_PSICY|nr:hypothetical protein CVT25_005078 [Psilocybe cyanescens]
MATFSPQSATSSSSSSIPVSSISTEGLSSNTEMAPTAGDQILPNTDVCNMADLSSVQEPTNFELQEARCCVNYSGFKQVSRKQVPSRLSRYSGMSTPEEGHNLIEKEILLRGITRDFESIGRIIADTIATRTDLNICEAALYASLDFNIIRQGVEIFVPDYHNVKLKDARRYRPQATPETKAQASLTATKPVTLVKDDIRVGIEALELD